MNDASKDSLNWIIAFGHKEGSERFRKFHPAANSEVEITLSPKSGDGYLCADGTISPDDVHTARFVASYAHF